jgi:4-hydroxybenzoate polyprenyltransferase
MDSSAYEEPGWHNAGGLRAADQTANEAADQTAGRAPSRAAQTLIRTRALLRTCHPGPSLAISAMITLLVAEAARHGTGPVLVAPAVLAGQISIGWSNDAFDAGRDAASGRTDKPIPAGEISRSAVGVAAVIALALSVVLSFAIGEITGIVNVVMMAAGWAYNAGLKSTLASGFMYVIGFGLIPVFAASTLPGHPVPRPLIITAAALLGLGGHFANVLPDLATDEAAGVSGLPQRVARHGGPAAARLCALVLLALASGLLVLASGGGHQWIAQLGLVAAVLLAVAGARGSGRLPFRAAIGIAAIDVALFAVGGVSLT